MSDLPPGWVEAPLASIATVQLGRQRSPKNHSGPNMRPYLRAANVTWNGLALDDIKEMNFSPTEMATFRLIPGDILLSEASGSASEVGKPALWRGEIDDCCFQNTILRVGASNLEPTYLLWFFKWLAVSGQFARSSRGVGIHHLGAKALSEWRVPVAPKAEQKRIVAAVEQQFSRLDAGVAALERAIQRVGLFRGALIESLIMGNGESVPLGEVIQVQSGFAFSSKDWTVSGVPVVKIANVRGGALDLTTCSYVAGSTAAKVPGCHLRENDVLVTLTGNVGAVAMVRHEGPLVLNQRVGRARIINPQRMVPRYLFYTLQARAVHAQIQRMSYGSNQANVSPSRIHEVLVWVPPVDQQKRVVQELEDSLGMLSQTESLLRSQLIRANRMRSSILLMAFSGKLVLQNLNDESASSLLEKMAMECSAPNMHKATKRKPRMPRK